MHHIKMAYRAMRHGGEGDSIIIILSYVLSRSRLTRALQRWSFKAVSRQNMGSACSCCRSCSPCPCAMRWTIFAGSSPSVHAKSCSSTCMMPHSIRLGTDMRMMHDQDVVFIFAIGPPSHLGQQRRYHMCKSTQKFIVKRRIPVRYGCLQDSPSACFNMCCSLGCQVCFVHANLSPQVVRALSPQVPNVLNSILRYDMPYGMQAVALILQEAVIILGQGLALCLV